MGGDALHSDAMGDVDRDLTLLLVGPVGFLLSLSLSLGCRDVIFQCL